MLETIEQEGLLEQAKHISQLFESRLTALAEEVELIHEVPCWA